MQKLKRIKTKKCDIASNSNNHNHNGNSIQNNSNNHSIIPTSCPSLSSHGMRREDVEMPEPLMPANWWPQKSNSRIVDDDDDSNNNEMHNYSKRNQRSGTDSPTTSTTTSTTTMTMTTTRSLLSSQQKSPNHRLWLHRCSASPSLLLALMLMVVVGKTSLMVDANAMAEMATNSSLMENASAVVAEAARASSTTFLYGSTTPMNQRNEDTASTSSPPPPPMSPPPMTLSMMMMKNATRHHSGRAADAGEQQRSNSTTTPSMDDSIFMSFARRFSTGNELWDGIIRDCYQRPSFSCFQKNVYMYLNDALGAHDVNVTQRLKFYKNQVNYDETMENLDNAEAETAEQNADPTEAGAAKDATEEVEDGGGGGGADESVMDEHLLRNEIPVESARAADQTPSPSSPIEEVTNALYDKSVKFAMTHDLEVKLPEMMFDGATFRISPRAIEGNGIIAKLELIPKQEVEARLAGKIIMNKIKKFIRSKLLLSFLALILIIKIIKIKLFWLLPIIIGVGAAKKLLLKFLLFLFPALSHLFKLCSYYQQTYHTTKYHHHHHLINHHHTVVPPWHSAEQNAVPEIIYTNPPKGHISAYLHGAPIHETYGPPSHPPFDHYEGGWENSGPGLGSEFISDINRAADIESNSNYFKPHTQDANELHAWGLGTTQISPTTPPQRHQQQQTLKQRLPITQQQRPPPGGMPLLQKQHPTSHSFNPFMQPNKQSPYGPKYKIPSPAQSAQHPVYTQPPQSPPRNNLGQGGVNVRVPQGLPAAGGGGGGGGAGIVGLSAAQIAAQYEPTHSNNPQQLQQPQAQQQQISPELSAQLKEAIRIQAEQRIIAQQQKILDKQPFVQDGVPLMPKDYDPFYTPIMMKIDKILEQLGVGDDLCKERLVCSMYKDPVRYSPHSNFISAELSRDTSELQPPATNTNPTIVRFYRLIQAARDGQEQRDCLQLYPQCNINTE